MCRCVHTRALALFKMEQRRVWWKLFITHMWWQPAGDNKDIGSYLMSTRSRYTLTLKLTDTLQPDWIHSCLYRSIPSEHLTDNTVSNTVTKHIHSQSLSCWWCSLEAALFPHSCSLCSCSVLVHQLISTCTQEHSYKPDASTLKLHISGCLPFVHKLL